MRWSEGKLLTEQLQRPWERTRASTEDRKAYTNSLGKEAFSSMRRETETGSLGRDSGHVVELINVHIKCMFRVKLAGITDGTDVGAKKIHKRTDYEILHLQRNNPLVIVLAYNLEQALTPRSVWFCFRPPGVCVTVCACALTLPQSLSSFEQPWHLAQSWARLQDGSFFVGFLCTGPLKRVTSGEH